VRWRTKSRDFKMVSMVGEGPLVLLAGPTAPFRDFKEFVSYAKANPGKVNYPSSGIGGQQHLPGEYISAALKLENDARATRGGGQATNDLVSGQIEAAVLGLGPTLAHMRRQTQGACRQHRIARPSAARRADPDRARCAGFRRHPAALSAASKAA
jgi:tripartite-type tricarboxylate transporter receptor subunit TctC